ncbi:MAG: MBL fold metallo-hydrolase [Phycisphaerales bacterium]
MIPHPVIERSGITIRGFTLGPWQTNCYVVSAEASAGQPAACWLIDASFTPGRMIAQIRDSGLRPSLLLLTHAHLDHIAGVAECCNAFAPLPVAINAEEARWLGDPELNLSMLTGLPTTAPGPDRELSDDETLVLGKHDCRVLHVPGHSPGSVAFYFPGANTVIAGDALFRESVGRTDFPNSSPQVLARSIRTRLYTLPSATMVLPGHGPATTIAHELKHNPFVRG